jgi:hypothetical protein
MFCKNAVFVQPISEKKNDHNVNIGKLQRCDSLQNIHDTNWTMMFLFLGL